MKKLFLAVLCAGLFFACGNKKQAEPETLIDTPACEQMVEETPAVEEQEPVAEVQEPAKQAAPAKKATPAKKTTNSSPNAQGAQKVDENASLKDQAKKAATNVGSAAIDKAESEATSTIVNSGKKKR